MYNYGYYDELYHYGVKGMKWGVRRRSQEVLNARTAYKSAKKDYSRAFDEAYNKSFAAYSPIKKHRQANDARWENAANKAEALNKAKSDYKQAKADDKAKRKAAKEATQSRNNGLSDKQKTALKIGAAAAGTALAAYGVYKVSKVMKDKKKTVDAGKTVVNEMMKGKSYHQMNAAEARGLRNQAVGLAVKNGYRPTGNNQVDMLNFASAIIPSQEEYLRSLRR